jgi:predicted Zn-dependent protease with MMP-like domain
MSEVPEDGITNPKLDKLSEELNSVNIEQGGPLDLSWRYGEKLEGYVLPPLRVEPKEPTLQEVVKQGIQDTIDAMDGKPLPPGHIAFIPPAATIGEEGGILARLAGRLLGKFIKIPEAAENIPKGVESVKGPPADLANRIAETAQKMKPEAAENIPKGAESVKGPPADFAKRIVETAQKMKPPIAPEEIARLLDIRGAVSDKFLNTNLQAIADLPPGIIKLLNRADIQIVVKDSPSLTDTPHAIYMKSGATMDSPGVFYTGTGSGRRIFVYERPESGEWDVEGSDAQHVLTHEIGHAIDFIIGKFIKSNPRPTGFFSELFSDPVPTRTFSEMSEFMSAYKKDLHSMPSTVLDQFRNFRSTIEDLKAPKETFAEIFSFLYGGGNASAGRMFTRHFLEYFPNTSETVARVVAALPIK